MRLDGKVACITGGASGIGRSTAEIFAREGARVAVADLDLAASEKAAAELPGDGHLGLRCDVSDSAAVAAAFARIGEECGRCDVLMNNAGVDRTPGDGSEKMFSGGLQIVDMSDTGWTRMLEIHLNGSFFCTRAAVPLMQEGGGSIINVSSIAGLAGMGPIHYSTAKAGLLGFTRSLARAVGHLNIRVNAICPGVIETPMTAAIDDAVLKPLEMATPLRRRGSAEEIATTALYLASDDSSFVTGQALSPNGGIHIG